MPVVRIDLNRFTKLVGAGRERILGRLPYVGLDIESLDKDSVRVEYSPNRPDFSTDYGIARALKGQLGIETGIPRYRISQSGIDVSVDRRLAKVRPFISCGIAKGMRLDNETVRQLISMQEDLHDGIGRGRRRVAIGLHDLDVLHPPIHYQAAPETFRFVPLGEREEMTLREVLTKTATGRAYSEILAGAKSLPLLRDSKGVVLSFPPIVNGEATKVSTKTKDIFVDVTSTDREHGEDALAIVATTLADAGGRLESVAIRESSKVRETPDLSASRMRLDLGLVRDVTGLRMGLREVRACLKKSRLGVEGGFVSIPRYRIDLMHPVDLAEEVVLGYGVDSIEPKYPSSDQPGRLNRKMQTLDRVAELMSASGFVEVMNFELVDEVSLYRNFSRSTARRIEVENPRSIEHCLLRDSLIPSLMSVLSRNVKEEYPQRIYEVGRVYERIGRGISERWSLGALVAHSRSSFSEAKAHLEAVYLTLAGSEVTDEPEAFWPYPDGRSASVSVNGEEVGHVGEVKPSAIVAFGLKVPVAGFEVDLSNLLLSRGNS